MFSELLERTARVTDTCICGEIIGADFNKENGQIIWMGKE